MSPVRGGILGAVALVAIGVLGACDPVPDPEVVLAAATPITPPRPIELPPPVPASEAVVEADADATEVRAAPEETETSSREPAPPVQSAPVEDFPDARFPRPEHVRGLYVNAWAAGSRTRMTELLELARRTEINTLVIDIKDASGYVSHRSNVALANEIGATGEIRIRDLPGLLDQLGAEGIYPIARIVIVKDPILTAQRPELAIQDTAGGVWVDSKGITWLNPYSTEVWRYHVDLAREVAAMGFPEIQWDYVRFPDAPESDLARALYRGAQGRDRAEAIRGFLAYARANLADLQVRSTADVFGVTTSYRLDVGTGQVWEDLIDVVDVALPMVYPSHYWQGSFGYRHPNAYPYEVVHRAISDALRRSATVEGAGLTRPWLQDFSLGAPAYDAAEVRAQIQGTYDAGVYEWVLWNPGSRYTAAALEPEEGFETEPLVRVAGVLTPVSRRHFVIDSVAALPRPVDTAEAVAPEAEPPADTIRPPDTLGIDTLRLPLDTIGIDSVAVPLAPLVLDTDTVGIDTLRVPLDSPGIDSVEAPLDTAAADTLRLRRFR